jgi:FkbM family methyltransferase
MLKNKVSTAYTLLRDGGIKNLYDYSRVRLQVLVKEHRKQVRLDGCLFSLEGITNDSIRVELFTNKYEAPERHAIVRYLKRDKPVIELGGSMGVVACVTNKLLTDPTAHVVVEANPLAIPQLEQNRKLNSCKFAIVNRAIAYGADSVTFRPSSDLAGSSITRAGDQAPVTVPAVQLREGLEYDLVCQEADVLKNADTIIMETHARYTGVEKLSDMMTRLKGLGFNLVEEIGFVVVLRQVQNVA